MDFKRNLKGMKFACENFCINLHIYLVQSFGFGLKTEIIFQVEEVLSCPTHSVLGLFAEVKWQRRVAYQSLILLKPTLGMRGARPQFIHIVSCMILN